MGKKCQESFNKIKKLLYSQPILTIFDPDRSIHIYTDASLQGVGAVKKAVYLECLAIKEVVKYWQYWLISRKFTIF